MAFLKASGLLLAGLMLLSGEGRAAPSEYQVKAVFLFNFSQFVDWPPSAFTDPDAPFAICVFGHDPFGSHLDDAARAETVNGRPLVVRRLHSATEIRACQIVFVPQSEDAQLREILAALTDRSTLTVTDLDGAAKRGAMIRLVAGQGRIRLRIDVESARAAGLTISSKLLRAAEIVGATPRED